MKLKNVMSTGVRVLTPNATVHEAAQLMATANVGIVPILDANGKAQGVITDRDVAVRVVGNGATANTKVADVMTRKPHTLSEDEDLDAALDLMQREKIGRVLICDKSGRVSGVFSLGDAVIRCHGDGRTVKVSPALAGWISRSKSPGAALH